MPGVPYEMEHILTHGVIPGMRNRLAAEGADARSGAPLHPDDGNGESQLAARIDDLETRWLEDGIKLAYLPSPGSVRIRLTAEGEAPSADWMPPGATSWTG